MADLHVLRVFTSGGGEHGNPLGLFPEGDDVPAGRRQAIALDLGFAETVFIDNPERGEFQIFTPEVELPFAGHPTVGTAWFLGQRDGEIAVVRPPAGEARVRSEAEMTWIAGRAEWSPDFEYLRFDSPDEVDALDGAPENRGAAYCWAWIDEEGGRIRARSFVPEAGIDEDEATGSAALALCAQLGQAIEVRQGRGSDLFARPLDDGWVEVGGRVVADSRRDYAV